MLEGYKRATNRTILVAWLVLLLGALTAYVSETLSLLAILLCLVSVVLFIRGCCVYAIGKGYSAWWGAVGLLNFPGLLLLVLFPDRR
jgi:hypothetical protein